MQTQKDVVLRLLHSDPGSPLLIEGYDFFHLGHFLKTEVPAHPSEPLITLGGESICTIDEIRDLISRLSKKGHARRFVVLERVHKFRKDASNALLKLLEEPPLDTHIVLTALPYASLATIRSRCSVVKFLSFSNATQDQAETDDVAVSLAQRFAELNQMSGEEGALLLESFIYRARESFLRESSKERAQKKGAVIHSALEMLRKGTYSKISLQNIFIMWKYA